MRIRAEGHESSATHRPVTSGSPENVRFLLHPHAIHRLAHDSAVDIFQPVIPPAHGFLQPVDVRPRVASRRHRAPKAR